VRAFLALLIFTAKDKTMSNCYGFLTVMAAGNASQQWADGYRRYFYFDGTLPSIFFRWGPSLQGGLARLEPWPGSVGRWTSLLDSGELSGRITERQANWIRWVLSGQAPEAEIHRDIAATKKKWEDSRGDVPYYYIPEKIAGGNLR